MIPVVKTYRSIPNIMDELFNNDSRGGQSENYERVCKPAVNIAENENSFQIDVAAPGFDRSELKVSVDDNVLTVATISKEKENKQKYLKREFVTSSFNRSFELPANIEADKIEASHSNGVLSINVPKKAKIEIPVQEIEVK